MMLFIINGDSPWTTFERWIGAAFLWHTIVNLSGILESKPWLLVSEITRLIFMPIGIILFNDWHTEPLYILLVLGTAMLSAFWTISYFRPNEILSTEEPTLKPS
jgi:hypothetical protein